MSKNVTVSIVFIFALPILVFTAFFGINSIVIWTREKNANAKVSLVREKQKKIDDVRFEEGLRPHQVELCDQKLFDEETFEFNIENVYVRLYIT